MRVRAESYDELAVLAQRAQALTNAAGAAIALNEGNAPEIICRARAGASAPEVGTALPLEGTFTGLCIQSGKELRCDDAETDSRVDKAAIRALGIRSMVTVPIKEEDRVVGVLAVFAPTAHAFKITHVVVLKTMAGQIADYLHRALRDTTHSPEALPAPPVNGAAVSAAASPSPAAVVTKRAERALTHRQLPVGPQVEPARANTLAEEIVQAPSRRKKERYSRDGQKESKTAFQRAFDALNAAAVPKKRVGANVLMIGAAAVVVIVVAVGLWLRLHRPGAAPQPTPEASSSPGTPAAPTPANLQPPANNTPPAPPAKQDEAQPIREEARHKRGETVVLPAAPSKIPGAKDDSAPASDAPAISLGNLPASGSLSNLVSSVSPPPNPRLLSQSEFEPVTAIKKVPPVYPAVARQRRLSGSVVVQGIVDKNGKISGLQLVSGPPLFRDAAFAAVNQWVFKPARLNGKAIDQWTTISLYFAAH
jgi:TonB family protein